MPATVGPLDEPAWRTLEYFALTRVLIASALLLSIVAFGAGPGGWSAPPFVVGSLAYFGLAAVLAVTAAYVHRRFIAQVALQLAIDLIVISMLLVLGGGLRSGVMILYLLPLAGAALLLPTVAVFFVCALAALTLLGDSVLRSLQSGGADATVFQAGLYGAALFAVAALLRFLAARLAAQESLARKNARVIENQLEINRLVIAQMEQGVVVVDATTTVRANNRAARVLLGLSPEAQLTGVRLAELPGQQPLTAAFVRWLGSLRASETADDEVATTLPELKLRARFVCPAFGASDEFAIFLEDVRLIEERAQQLKLAAMGRLTASIAHEIRNPLGAIDHAAQLLVEEARGSGSQRLAAIVHENAQRLNRLVEDVLRAVRREAPLGEVIDLTAFMGSWIDEFGRDRRLSADRFVLEVEAGLQIRFEESHLRQVLYNLMDNALRFSSGSPASVVVVAERSGEVPGAAQLWVIDDGPGIAAGTRDALFEPFYTTSSRGTGLGLYMAREFCLVNRADLAYAKRASRDCMTREGFVVRFAPYAESRSALAGFLDTIPT